MYKRIFFLLIVFSVFIKLNAQIPDDFVRIDSDNIDGLKISKERSYTHESLFGYMNGGAELYLEYGFDRLVVSEVTVNGNDLKIEVYRMPSKDMAFGIYSVNIFKCAESENLTDYFCQSDYQVQFCKGNYYVSIINNSGLVEGLNSARIIAGNIIAKINASSFNLEDYLPEEFIPASINRIMLVSGKVSMDNNAYQYSGILEGFSDYEMLIIESDDDPLLAIRFNTGDQLEKFRNSLGIDQFPACGEEIPLEGKTITLTNKGDILIRIDAN